MEEEEDNKINNYKEVTEFLNDNKDHVLGVDDIKTTYNQAFAIKLDDLYDYVKKNDKMFLILQEKNLKFYMDLDIKERYEYYFNYMIKNKKIYELMKDLIEFAKEFFISGEIYKITNNDPYKYIIWKSNHDQMNEKLSFHVYLPGLIFENRQEMKNFVEEFVETIKDKYEFLKDDIKSIDSSVYSDGRKFRLPLCKKFAESDNHLELFDTNYENKNEKELFDLSVNNELKNPNMKVEIKENMNKTCIKTEEHNIDVIKVNKTQDEFKIEPEYEKYYECFELLSDHINNNHESWVTFIIFCCNLYINNDDDENIIDMMHDISCNWYKYSVSDVNYEINEILNKINDYEAVEFSYYIFLLKEDSEETYVKYYNKYVNEISGIVEEQEFIDSCEQMFNKIININQEYVSTNTTQYFIDYFINFVKSSTGTGKSELIKTIIKENPTKNFIYTTSNISTLKEFKRRIGDIPIKILFYQDNDFEEYNYKESHIIVVCQESLHKLKCAFNNYIIFVDEFTTFFQEIFSWFNLDTKAYNQGIFNEMINTCEKLFLFDGYYDSRQLDVFMSWFKNRYEIEKLMLMNEYNPHVNKKIKLYIDDTFTRKEWNKEHGIDKNINIQMENVIYKLNKSMHNDKKIVIVSDSASYCNRISDYIENCEFSHEKRFTLTASKLINYQETNNNEYEQLKETFFENNEELCQNSEILIYSPVLTAGIDIEVHFEVMFCFWFNKSLNYVGELQEMNRIRHYKKCYMYYHNINNYDVEEGKIMQEMYKFEKITQIEMLIENLEKCELTIKYEIKKTFDDVFDGMMMNIEKELLNKENKPFELQLEENFNDIFNKIEINTDEYSDKLTEFMYDKYVKNEKRVTKKFNIDIEQKKMYLKMNALFDVKHKNFHEECFKSFNKILKQETIQVEQTFTDSKIQLLYNFMQQIEHEQNTNIINLLKHIESIIGLIKLNTQTEDVFELFEEYNKIKIDNEHIDFEFISENYKIKEAEVKTIIKMYYLYNHLTNDVLIDKEFEKRVTVGVNMNDKEEVEKLIEMTDEKDVEYGEQCEIEKELIIKHMMKEQLNNHIFEKNGIKYVERSKLYDNEIATACKLTRENYKQMFEDILNVKLEEKEIRINKIETRVFIVE